MSALAPYIPAKDALFSAWLQNFSVLITASPGTYGLTSGDATAIAADYTTWAAAYALVTSPSTKTPTTVSAKNTAKIGALALARGYAVTVSLNAGVSSSNKTALGVNPRTSVPTPITTPTTRPIISAIGTSTAGTVLTYKDSSTPSVKSKPYGVAALLLFAKASATPITDPSALTFIDLFTKSPLTLSLGAGAAGMTVYIAGRWVTRKGLLGPWSTVINYVVAG